MIYLADTEPHHPIFAMVMWHYGMVQLQRCMIQRIANKFNSLSLWHLVRGKCGKFHDCYFNGNVALSPEVKL